jgi:hypothetical protein
LDIWAIYNLFDRGGVNDGFGVRNANHENAINDEMNFFVEPHHRIIT